jgi:osmotically-inducible protein OsmY
MSEPITNTERADIDIVEDIEHLIAHYPPLAKDRHALHVSCTDGVVTLSGHVFTPNTRRYFLDRLGSISGILDVNAEHLYDDQTIRLDIAPLLPEGMLLARIRYGVVVLAGEVPEGANLEQVVEQVRNVSGVVKVVSGFGG